MEVLEIGSTGKAVKELQEKLNKLAGIYYLEVDGDYGVKTSRAVQVFQKDNDLEVDGIAGSKTQTKLNEVYNELFPEAKSLRERLECHITTGAHSKAYPPKTKYFSIKNGLNDVFHQIVDYMDVENDPYYQRRKRKSGITDTYCNVYAYHFLCHTWAYIPRVWWDKETFDKIYKEGESVNPVYGANCSEMNANALFSWLWRAGRDFFGWEKVDTPEEFQKAVNNGAGGVICAKRHNLKRSGHITIGIPENEQYKIINGVPLQSQAGWDCWNYHNKSWYLSGKFREYGFFINRQPKN